MLRRKAYDSLLEWKNQSGKKALCIIGARQIGKTTLVREFGAKEYEHFVEINFVTDPMAQEIFSGSLDAERILTNLTAYVQKEMVPGKTLVLFDEIQECPEVRTAIKFLVEDGRFDYIESGSLLGVRYKEIRSYPVGFEEIFYMYPMDFEEYLWANNVQEKTVLYLKDCYEKQISVSESVHHTMLQLFYSYIVVGGMPDVVQTYVDTNDIGKVVKLQRDILELYRLDIAKYASGSDKIKIQSVFDSIPAQLNEKNRRFMLSKIDKNGRQNRYAEGFRWLEDAGVALPCYNVTEPQPPLQLNEKHNLFKLFLNDTGLLCAACMENVQFSLLKGDLSINLGSILENIMAQQLRCNGFHLHYFDSKKYGEIDFVLQKGSKLCLLEVKSGNDFKKHAAMNRVCDVNQWKIDEAVVFCKGNVERTGKIIYFPWYFIMFFKPDSIPQNLKFTVDISQL